MGNKISDKLAKVFDIYASKWEKMDEAFKRINEPNNYLDPKFYKSADLTREEKDKLLSVAGSEDYIFRFVHELLGPRFVKEYKSKQTIDEAKAKLNFKFLQKIPLKDTCSLRELYFCLPKSSNKPQVTQEEFRWLYVNGYFPHLYWNNGKPRFYSNMWFMIDLVIREARQETGLGVLKKFSDWKPSWWVQKNRLKLVTYMYNSWNLGSKIIDYADKKARASGLHNEEFRNFLRELQHSLWINEGKLIADEVVNNSGLVDGRFNLIKYFRDIFALLSFEAFPGKFIIDLYHNPNQRMAVMFSFDNLMRLAVYNFDYANVNTYSDESLSRKYSLLFAATDWALSMQEGVTNRKESDIVNMYRREKDDKVPCRICGSLFTPKRKIDVTCGKKECITQNKYLSKQKKRIDTPPLVN